MKKIILLLLLAVFVFAAAGFCNDAGSGENESGHHCLVCCGAEHSYVLESEEGTSAVLTASQAVIVHAVLYQDLFVSGIDRPPAVTL